MSTPPRQPANRAYLVLGSNIHPEANLPAAAAALKFQGDITAASRVWESRPVDLSDQPNYLNAAVLLETSHSIDRLYQNVIAPIEQSLRRQRDPQNKYAPRTIDIDLALFNREVLTVDGHKIPDPDILKRPFMATCLAELEPGYLHPELDKTLEQIAHSLRQAGPPLRYRPDVELYP